jgi:OmpA-OmpF porin, OOP family
MKTHIAMKPTFTFFVSMLFIWSALQLPAQTQKGANYLSAKVLFIDYGRPNDIDGLDITNGLEVAYIRTFNRFVGLTLPIKAGVINVSQDINNRNFASIDLLLRLQYEGENSRVVPYVFGGAGSVWESFEESNSQFPFGAGLNIRVGKNSYINLQGEYRKSQIENRNNLQGGLGFVYRFGRLDRDGDGIADSVDDCPDEPGPVATNGCPDRDGDGIADMDDQCPDTPGLAATAGCPDRDGDGIADKDDDCPDVAGLASLKGCPDRDGDGIADHLDQCPDEPGEAAMNGCPDGDGDGVADRFDKCPDEAGPASNQGCPIQDRDGDGIPDDDDLCPDEAGPATTGGCPDRDGDGVPDKDDRCPDVAGPYAGCPDTDGDGVIDPDDLCPDEPGPVSNKGCPEVEEKDREVLELAMQAVQFETGKATLKNESLQVLDQIAAIMERYGGYKLHIAGHTDNVGNPTSNQKLSEARALACYQYLIAKGVPIGRLTYSGHGATQPIASNKTSRGRSLNRRVEFRMAIE